MTPEEKLHTYLQATSAYGSKAIPGKNAFTFISKGTGIPQVWTLDSHQEPILFRSFDDRVISVHHAPEGDKTVVGMDYEGDEKQQLYLIEEGTETPFPLVVSQEHFHNFGGFSPDGDQIAFSSNRRNPGYFDIFIQNLGTKEIRKVYAYDGICHVLQWLPDGEHLLISMNTTNLDNKLYILNIDSGSMRTLGSKDKDANYQSIIFLKDKETGYALTDLDAETHYVARFSLYAPHELEPIFHADDWDVEELELSPDENTLLLTVNEGGYSRLVTLDTTTHAENTIDGLPAGVMSSLSWLDDKRCIFTLKTPIEPGDIWQVHVEDSKVNRLTFFGQSLASAPLYEPKLCHYESFDGLKVPYFYYDNNDASDKPAVVHVHGGPEGQTKAEYNPIFQYLVSEGFAVAAPNVRGSSGYGRSYIHLDDVRKRMDSVKDLTWLVKDLISTHNVGSHNIGIMGRSYGGFMVLAAMTHYPDLWAAGVDIVGISHFKTFLENTGAWRRSLRENEYGSLEHDIDFFEEIAPLNHSEKINAPLLVFHGRNDTRVPVSEAEQLVGDMQARGQSVELTIFEDEGHQTEKLANHVTMHTDTADFFQKHLRDSGKQ